MHDFIPSVQVPSDLHFNTVKEAIYQKVPEDLWQDAMVGNVIEYLYANKQLRLTDSQKHMLHVLGKAWGD